MEDSYNPFSYLTNLSKTGLQNKVYVGGSVINNNCLSPSTSCSSLIKAYNSIKFNNYSINFIEESELESYVFDYPSYLKNSEGNANILVSSDSYLDFHSLATVENLTFLLPDKYNYFNLIFSQSIKIKLKSLTFKLKEGVSFCNCR